MDLGIGVLAAPGLAGLHSDALLGALLSVVIFLANLAGGVIVGVATVRGLWQYVTSLLFTRGEDVPKEAIRLMIGRSLALALEFQLGADILATAREPTLHDIGVLAAIVVLRTALNFFLQRELREANRTEEAASGATSPARNSSERLSA